MARISGAGHTDDPSHRPPWVRPPRSGDRVHGVGGPGRDPGVLRQSQETTAAGRQDPAAPHSVADSVRDQFPFNSNQLCGGCINVDAGQQLLLPARRESASRDACQATLRLSVAQRSRRRICDRCDMKLHEN